MTSDRHPVVCPADAIRAAYRPGLRIVWAADGGTEVWEVVEADNDAVTTRITAPDGTKTTSTATFEDLSMHSAFPIDSTTIYQEEFETSAGRFSGTHCVVATPGGDTHFYFSGLHAGPPIWIEGPGVSRQQIERSDLKGGVDETS